MATYHEGERALQEQAGSRVRSDRILRSVHPEIPPAARAFLEASPFVVVATTDRDGWPWASIVAGGPGSVRVVDERTVCIVGAPARGDPLEANSSTSRWLGLLAIDPMTRRRMRLNGTLEATAGGGMHVHAREVYANCLKYIQRRQMVSGPIVEQVAERVRSRSLDGQQRARIRTADTFFIASVHPERGADASHRGGMPGFVDVDGDRLSWPDYAGNSMFNTLGNLLVFPRAGLLFTDFETGSTLQIAGRTRVVCDVAEVSRRPGAERLVEMDVTEVVETRNAFPLRFRFDEYSPFNPVAGVTASGT